MDSRSRPDSEDSESSQNRLRLWCPCGEWIEYDALDGIVTCGCGERDAVTATPLR